MTFQEQLNVYLSDLSATHKELAEASGLSEATISRYCSGERVPSFQSAAISQLADGISHLADEKQMPLPQRVQIEASLNVTVRGALSVDYDVFLSNLQHLLSDLNIRTSELARGLYIDSSHISKILSGTRRPGNVDRFISDVATYIAHRYAGSADLSSLARIIDIDPASLASTAEIKDTIIDWLGSSASVKTDDSIPRFLTKLDDFDLGDYLKAVRFDEIKLPPAMPHLPTRKEYTGIAQMMESEIDFMKTTVLSRAMEDCILYSDMPLTEMAADPEFPKKYMLGMAMMLKKGLHIHQIHDINRPFREMMLGLESWIPLYMTGQISPYYLPASQNVVFSHFLKVSGSAALEGTAIVGHQGDGKYVLYQSKEDVRHYRARAGQLLSKASPLMDIYQKEQAAVYLPLLQKSWSGDDRKIICSHLPFYFLSEARLHSLLSESDLPDDQRADIMAQHDTLHASLVALLQTNKLHLVIPQIEKSGFAAFPIGVSLTDVFVEQNLPLDYATYAACVEELDQLAKQYPNFTLEKNPSPPFHHINIMIVGDKMVIVSKEKHPTIHFVIHHKKMIRAFRNFIPPIVE